MINVCYNGGQPNGIGDFRGLKQKEGLKRYRRTFCDEKTCQTPHETELVFKEETLMFRVFNKKCKNCGKVLGEKSVRLW